jgi:hypothetical protein
VPYGDNGLSHLLLPCSPPPPPPCPPGTPQYLAECESWWERHVRSETTSNANVLDYGHIIPAVDLMLAQLTKKQVGGQGGEGTGKAAAAAAMMRWRAGSTGKSGCSWTCHLLLA